MPLSISTSGQSAPIRQPDVAGPPPNELSASMDLLRQAHNSIARLKRQLATLELEAQRVASERVVAEELLREAQSDEVLLRARLKAAL